MEITTIVGTLGKALWGLKTMCDQHKVNKSDIPELYNFIQDLQQCTPALEKRFTEGGRDHLGSIMLNKLARDISEATEKLNRWLTDRNFFCVLSARDRKVELQNMHAKVMSSIQKNLAMASLLVLLDVRASQATIIEQGTDMKSLLTARIESVQGRMLSEVRAQVVEASRSPFADEKFWQEVLAAVDSRHDADYVSRDQLRNLYEDPITAELMIDPVVASNGDTYCRWTIIDNDMKRNPVNLEEALTIVVDNLIIQRGLFEAFPEQYVKFQQRRQQYRLQALIWVSDRMLADAEVALQNVLQWDKNDKQCAEVLVQVQRALDKAKGKFAEPSSLSMGQSKLEGVATPSSSISRSLGVSKTGSNVMAIPNPASNVEENVRNFLNTSKCSEYLTVSADKLSVKYTGPNDTTHNYVGSIQANRPAVCRESIYYFEVTIKDCGSTSRIGIGFTDDRFKNCMQPGWDEVGYGYHGDNGHLFQGSGQHKLINGKPYAFQYTTGDTVGAGINYASHEIFFTKNGNLLPSISMVANTPLYATIGLHSYNAEVKINFGQQRFLFDIEGLRHDVEGHLQTHLNTSMCSKYLTVSANKLSVKYTGPNDTTHNYVGSIQANRLAVCRESIYYFEVTIKDCGSTSRIGIGFTDGQFKNCRQPGWDEVGYGYHGDDGHLFQGSGQHKLINGKPYAFQYTTGDTVGAGINYASHEIFFTKNGNLLPSISMVANTPLYATIGLHSYNAEVKINFGQQRFLFDIEGLRHDVEGHLQTHLNASMCNKYLIVSADKLSVKCIGPNDTTHDDGGSIQANRPAVCRESIYYFEVTIKDCGSTSEISIGFTDGQFKNWRFPRWDEVGYGYHGDDGHLYQGSGRFKLINDKPYAFQYTTGDTVGAGINYASHEIFFTKNGNLLPSISMVANTPLYASVGLSSYNAEVKINFGQQRFLFDIEGLRHDVERHLQTHLNASMCNKYLIVSADKLSVKCIGPNDTTHDDGGSIQANRPAVCRESIYYFEVTIKDCGSTSEISIGFTDGQFKNWRFPGWDEVGYGYHGDDGHLYQGSGRFKLINDKPYAFQYTTGDIVGAGINYASHEIFFTKNGNLLPSISMVANTPLYATVGLSSYNAEVKINFGQQRFLFDIEGLRHDVEGHLQTHLNTSMCSKYLTVSANKLSVKYTGPNDTIHNYVGSIQANRLAVCRESIYYFEVTIKDCGSTSRIGIGFTDGQFKNWRYPGWDEVGYGYHGDDGHLFQGSDRHKLINGKPYAFQYTTGDTVGAGINYASHEIFFTKNGNLLPSISMVANTPLYASVGLSSYNAEVKINFGQQRFLFDIEGLRHDVERHLQTHLNASMCNKYLIVSADKLSVKCIGPNDTTHDDGGSIQANRPAVCRESIYYFEVTIKDCGSTSEISIGFTDGQFKNWRFPGWDEVGYGYHGDDGHLYQGSGRFKLINDKPYAFQYTTGDIVGAGINYASHEIFFTKNGNLLPSISMVANTPLYATVGLSSYNAEVKINFGQQRFLFDIEGLRHDVEGHLQTHLNTSMCSKYLTVSANKLSVKYTGPNDTTHNYVGSIQANRLAICRESIYYFEVTIKDCGSTSRIGIGFTDGQFKNWRYLGWDEVGYGYHGDDGHLYQGSDRHKLINGKPYAFQYTTGDTVGAGINYASHEIFFTKNGNLLPSISMVANTPLYATIGLHSYNAEVKINFGQQRFLFDIEGLRHDVEGHLQTHLNASMCNKYLIVSADKFSVKCIGPNDTTRDDGGSIQANRPAVCHESIYYFEVTIKDCGSTSEISIGFTDGQFKNWRFPGWDEVGYGYHGDDGHLYQGSGRFKLINDKPYAFQYTTGDIVGAGINYASHEIFFTKNGNLLPNISMVANTPLYATVGLSSYNAEVKINFGQQRFLFDIEGLRDDVEGHQ